MTIRARPVPEIAKSYAKRHEGGGVQAQPRGHGVTTMGGRYGFDENGRG